MFYEYKNSFFEQLKSKFGGTCCFLSERKIENSIVFPSLVNHGWNLNQVHDILVGIQFQRVLFRLKKFTVLSYWFLEKFVCMEV